jgi:hypothetical protein
VASKSIEKHFENQSTHFGRFLNQLLKDFERSDPIHVQFMGISVV